MLKMRAVHYKSKEDWQIWGFPKSLADFHAFRMAVLDECEKAFLKGMHVHGVLFEPRPYIGWLGRRMDSNDRRELWIQSKAPVTLQFHVDERDRGWILHQCRGDIVWVFRAGRLVTKPACIPQDRSLPRYEFAIVSSEWQPVRYFSGAHFEGGQIVYTLTSKPLIQERLSIYDGYEPLLEIARRYCKQSGGTIVVLDPQGTPIEAYEWKDKGNVDAGSCGEYYEEKIDHQVFTNHF